MNAPRRPALPGATLGVLGGGQLGRMFVHAAQAMGYATAVLDPDPQSPAGRVSHRHLRTAYLDLDGLAQLASCSAAITTEFENVPAAALRRLAAERPVAPGADAVAICQSRALEKAHFERSGVACVPYAVIDDAPRLAAVSDALLPGLLKTTSLGYDGKGQLTVPDRAALAGAWAELGSVPCVLEQRVALACELSVILARDAQGAAVHLPVQHNLHRGGVLAVTQVPAPVDASLQQRAIDSARRIAAALDYVGVLCVEFFVLEDGTLLANEMAPRPHNSGHYSIDACDVSQFELQVRTLAGLPLVQPRLHSCALMLNLLGDLWQPAVGAADSTPREPAWADVLALPGVHLHLYGKSGARRGRKMGHLTVTAARPDDARRVALQCAALLGIEAF